MCFLRLSANLKVAAGLVPAASSDYSAGCFQHPSTRLFGNSGLEAPKIPLESSPQATAACPGTFGIALTLTFGVSRLVSECPSIVHSGPSDPCASYIRTCDPARVSSNGEYNSSQSILLLSYGISGFCG